MSSTLELFYKGIEDAESILSIYDSHNQNGEKVKDFYPAGMPNIDVLKRACVIMAFTAFESFFENNVRDINSKQINDFSNDKRNKLLEHFHNPTSENITKLYKTWFGIENCLKAITFDGRNTDDICKQLDDYLKIRGQIVHVQKTDSTSQDIAKRDNVLKILGFLKKFAENFDRYIESNEWIAEVRERNATSSKADEAIL